MIRKKYTVLVWFIWFTVITLLVSSCEAQDFSSSAQKYKPNLDFLQHESGTPPPKRDYLAQFPPLPSKSIPSSSTLTPYIDGNIKLQPSGKRDYVAADFPPLKPSSMNHNNGHFSTVNPTSSVSSMLPQKPGGKRDYVAKDFPPLKPPVENYNKDQKLNPTSSTTTKNTQPTNAKRDYVAPQFTTPVPPMKPSQSSHTKGPMAPTSPTTVATSKNTQQTNARRDYVAPQFTTPTPSATSNGQVKDLINFFGGGNGNKKPSYSSKLGGGQSTPSTMRPNQPAPASSTLGINKHSTTIPSSPWTNGYQTTAKPTRVPLKPLVPTTNTRNPATQRPISTFMPSSFVNNKNDQNVSPSDVEIETLSEELLRKDSNNAAKLITVNVQERTSSQSKDDKAPQPLLVIPDKVWSMPTIQKFVPLLDNYERDTTVNEYITPQERNEENAFMDAIMSTAVIRHLMNFFKEKGYVTPDPRQQRDFMKQLWFSLYARSRGKLSSSGFEHIFVSEMKNGEVSGLHNWIYFSKEEAAHRINYLGYLKYLQLNDKGAVIKLHFNQQGLDKPVDTMFIGTSPELEVALYTLCFVTRADKDCKLKLAGKDVNIVSHTFRYRSKNLIGSAYPQI